MSFDFCDNLGVGDFREPFLEEALNVLLKSVVGHAPEVAVEDTFHSSRTEHFIEGEEEDENEGEGNAGGFLPENVGAKDKLGVPRDDGLIEIKEDVFLRIGHGRDCREMM